MVDSERLVVTGREDCARMRVSAWQHRNTALFRQALLNASVLDVVSINLDADLLWLLDRTLLHFLACRAGKAKVLNEKVYAVQVLLCFCSILFFWTCAR